MLTSIQRRENTILKWFKDERDGKYTSLGLIISRFALMKELLNIIKGLEESGKLKKLKSGYKLNKT